ncbi:hypothetical protein CKM354_000859500 [Cercospora kikuchii]|uniref:Carboxylic ester hydrolase n=1 Tax=Cercospora kikuchii TaxID=84275 RepID=A0A9P3CME7_9PEZI|nr:uncharacterized protein CKM354_000859500 [Cercospora kikuchii]GIZ45428.1 hypothetical protein CKM354_000859500 [Cercospora kikuchii]
MRLRFRPLLALLALLGSATSSPVHNPHDELLIKTDVFAVQGTVWPNNSAVYFFGNIPYAEPPIGNLRFRPPVTKSPSSEVRNGTWFGPSCIQYNNGQPTVYSEYLNGFLLSPGQNQSEDCLTVNVWAPKDAKAGDDLPVMIWIHGGGHTSGGAASPYKYGDRLAADQNVIVVAMNYRVNIFGYPGAAALDGRNLNPGLMDQRKAVEWTYANINAFGGSPEQMILFGQSAGGSSVDMYSYAYPFDPLVKGFIAKSGVASNGPVPTGSNFTYVADLVGCGNATSSEAELQCMQEVDAEAIIKVYNEYNSTLNEGRSLSFSTAADNQTRFTNYTDLQSRGLFAQIPTLYSTTNNEAITLVTYTGPSGVNQTEVDLRSASGFSCPGDQAAAAKSSLGVPVWRTRYFGEWPNLNPLPWLGAYHSSDIPMIFGTSDLLGEDTEAEREVSEYYQSAWAAFARDPENGLLEYGWPKYVPSEETLIELGREGTTEAVFVAGDKFQGMCQG